MARITKDSTCLAIISFLLIAGCGVAWSFEDPSEQKSPFTVVAGIPPGFERFHEPQLTAVDLYYGGRFVFTTLAEYTPETILFREPEKIAANIPGLDQTDEFITRISETLPNNQDMVCQRPGQPLCGRLSPEIAGVIFDEARFRATLFINPSLLSEAAVDDPRYLPPPDSGPVTVVQNLNFLASGNSGASGQFSLYGTTRAGYQGHYGFADWASTQKRAMSFDALGYTHLLRDHEITSGLFEQAGGVFSGIRRDMLLGARFSTSDNLRQDRDSIIASPIEIFLPTRGRVDVFRDGRLIGSGFYEAGNQLIDSSRLPPGSYLIDIVVTDDLGNQSTQQELFVKSSLLPPPGSPRWFVEGGSVRLRDQDASFPTSAGASMLSGGYKRRFNQFLGWGAAGLITNEQGMLELSGNAFSQWIELAGETFISSEGGSGWGLRGSARVMDTNISVITQRSRSDDQSFLDEADYALLEGGRWFYSLQANRRPVLGGTIGFSHSYSGADGIDGSEGSHRTSLSYQGRLAVGSYQSISYGAELSRIDDDNRVQLSVSWRSSHKRWTHSAQTEWVNSDIDDTDGLALTAATNWHDQDIYTDDIRLGASLRRDSNSQSMSLNGEHKSRWGKGNADLSFASADDASVQQYLIGYETSVVLDEQRRLSVGGPMSGHSAVVVDLQGAEDVTFDVLTNGTRRFSASGGGRVPVPLSPYDVYQISLQDTGTVMASYDEAPHQAVLYTGDVDTLDFSVDHINILVSRVFTLNNVCSDITGECYTIPQVLPDRRIEGVKGLAFTDSRGFFQAEISSTVTQLRAVSDEGPCIIDLSELEPQNGIMRARRLYCEPEQTEVEGAELIEESSADADPDATPEADTPSEE